MRYPVTPPPWAGRCLCGKVKFTLNENPLTFYICHCTDCQQRSGAPMRAVMWVKKSALSVVEGEPQFRALDMGNGRQRRAMLCGDCDTRLWSEPPDKPEIAILFPTTLQNAGEFEPVAHIWVKSALSWTALPEDIAQFETQPAAGVLVKLWQNALVETQAK